MRVKPGLAQKAALACAAAAALLSIAGCGRSNGNPDGPSMMTANMEKAADKMEAGVNDASNEMAANMMAESTDEPANAIDQTDASKAATNKEDASPSDAGGKR